MVRNSGKQDPNGQRKGGETKGQLEDDLDALFRLPLAEFTAARNTLAARLKQAKRGSEADFVKALVKPSVTAWTVNQLYWTHRETFDRLIATGERFRQVQTSRLAQKAADMRSALDARREELSKLSDLAIALLREAGHNPTPDTIHRITTTLEAMSAYASLPNAPRPGRLTHDVDPPGFESLASLMPGAGMKELREETARVTSSQKPGRAAARQKAEPADDMRQLEETRQASVAAAKVSLRDAKGLLSEARARAQRLEAAEKKANAEAKKAEKQRREAEEHFEKARAASEAAARRARSITIEVEEAANAVHDAKRAVEKASQELELLSRDLQVT